MGRDVVGIYRNITLLCRYYDICSAIGRKYKPKMRKMQRYYKDIKANRLNNLLASVSEQRQREETQTGMPFIRVPREAIRPT